MLIEVYFQEFHDLIQYKHEGREDNVLSSDAPFLADVLKEIEKIQK